MWRYETRVVWKDGKEGTLNVDGGLEIKFATPPDFGGPHGHWSPEQLLMGALGGCLMTTGLYYLQKLGVDLRSYASNCTGTMQKTRDGLAFTEALVDISITVGSDEDVKKTREAMLLAEKGCPVSKTLQCPVRVGVDVRSIEKQ